MYRMLGSTLHDKEFKEAMADAASTIIKYFKGNLAYVALMVNMSIDCDCADKPVKPLIHDIGILSSNWSSCFR